MPWWKILLVPAGCLFVGSVLRLWAKSEQPIRATVRMILRSEALLLVVYLAGLALKIPISLSPATAIWAAVAGIPGVVTLVGAELLLPL